MRLNHALAALLLATQLPAQWSTNPASPMVVCDAPNDQRFLTAISDGADGWYTFWSDMRANVNKGKLYGQHFNNAGVAQWDANGRLIWEKPGSSVNEMAPVLVEDGNVMIAVMDKANAIFQADTVRAILIDSDANMLWPEPVVLSTKGTYTFGNVFSYQEPQGFARGDGAWFAYVASVQGSNGMYIVQRVRRDGSIAIPPPGKPVPIGGSYGPYMIHTDQAGGMVLTARCSNGNNTCLKAMRVDSTGTALWPNPLDISAGGAGLTYDYKATIDGQGGLAAAWVESNDIAMQRYDTAATKHWNPGPFYACTESHYQDKPHVVFQDDALYIAWVDNRPAPGPGLYMQKVDWGTGALLWDADGVAVITENVYIPTARVVASDSGAVIAIMDMTGPHKYCAMRVRSDGSLAWTEPGPLATNNGPFYENRIELPDGQGGVVSFWEAGNKNIYGARVDRFGLTGVHTGVGAVAPDPWLRIQPNPAQEQVTLHADRPMDRVEVLSTDGRLVRAFTPRTASTVISLDGHAPGVYIIRAWCGNTVQVERLVKR